MSIDLGELEPGRVATGLTVTENLLNFHGTPHGDAVYSLADVLPSTRSSSSTRTATG